VLASRSFDSQLGYKVPASDVITPLLLIMELREGDVVNESLLARGSTMHMSTIDAYGIASPSEKVPLVRIVKAIPMERHQIADRGHEFRPANVAIS